jgi:hypothetical protein
MLISLHLPKTAGTSFRVSLEAHFGPAFLADYNDIPINRATWIRNCHALTDGFLLGTGNFSGTECIHGHFLPLKYRLLAKKRSVTFVTWFRHPVDRVISHYYFWKTHHPAVLPPLHARMIREEWTLERFCLGKEMKDIYHQFLWGFPLDNFSFIGITEYYEEDFIRFARNFLGRETPVLELNKSLQAGSHPVSETLRHEIEVYHKKDMVLYAKALELRRKQFS